MTMAAGRTLVVLGTGGTIAGRSAQAQDNVGYQAATLSVGEVLATLPRSSGWDVETEQVAQVDSKDMGASVWRALLSRTQHHLQRPEVRGIVITHGTDTLEETAYLLQTVLNPAKPVVLASAMRPASALVPDGPQNLQDALRLAGEPQARGVVAVCAGVVHGAMEVRKVHPYRLDAFDSGECGPLGVVEEGRIRLWRPWPNAVQHRADLLERLLACPCWPRVEWLNSHADAGAGLVQALLAQRQAALTQGWDETRVLRGLVVAGTGNGTVHRSLEEALRLAQAQGVEVWLTTRCAQGRVVPAQDGRLAFTCTDLPPAKARLALTLALL